MTWLVLCFLIDYCSMCVYVCRLRWVLVAFVIDVVVIEGWLVLILRVVVSWVFNSIAGCCFF